MEQKENEVLATNTPTVISNSFCGIIMPISDSEGYESGHWGQVRSIISEAVRDADYEPRIVSDGNNSSIIHARIITNIYQDDIVVCDVSSLNSNVMLEFGLRLASKKPIVVIKDNITKYSFDASPIEYVPYPANLDYYGVNNFKEKLLQQSSMQ
ncbi:conserved hypothetical protein [Hymenobacter roseosalivarius DSM 11622]|uniref:Nucleoside 2-deoxyribosyltransferase n=1 Tax=Hymenobacter roseosalivarius DSM 11622 TaxID=645990 RepID=A0A1W1W3R1_9BACT|nr:hypothetical protein [Hymenobacter roseosalivarius]SMC00100.1 conserved hypothetical protein [Hymenobacter roseosalivarius DSM 11622]